jgi:hypothetical protein
MILRSYYHIQGEHVYLTVFVGPHEGALGKAGDLVMRMEEFADLLQNNVKVDFRPVGPQEESGGRTS